VPCFSPNRAWRARGGGVTFNRDDAWSDRPLELPCGQCVGCRIEKARQWAVRCVHEAQTHENNSFITLTYNQEHLPKPASLDVRDWQNFAKRLRKEIGPFRFFHCGEYGGDTFRPHYHALIFGWDFPDKSIYKMSGENPLFVSQLLEDKWGKGFCTIGRLTVQSAGYVARYAMKKVTGKKAAMTRWYERIDPETGVVYELKPEYATMSRRPGLGAEWFERFSGDVYPSDEVILEGKRYRPPRFYDEKLGEDYLAEIKGKRIASVGSRGKDLTPERLLEREFILEDKLKKLERKL